VSKTKGGGRGFVYGGRVEDLEGIMKLVYPREGTSFHLESL
jgi:hypothetical protein